MFKVTNLALMAALFGSGNNFVTAGHSTGCFPSFSSSTTYFAGSKISASRQVTTETSCSGTTNGCVNGKRSSTETVKENYECTNAIRCSQAGYEPTALHGGQAWTRKTECDGTAPAPEIPTPSLWSGGGCPDAYTSGADYEAGDTVSVNQGSFSMVYSCKTGDWCGDSGYEPGSSLHWGQAWSEEGACTGSLTPTASPDFVSLEDLGGCPEEFSTSAEYEADDKVAVDGFVYQCKAFPASGWCEQDGYEPNEGLAWSEAWNGPLGYCSGTIEPTSSPDFSALTLVGGCPKEWTQNSGGDDNLEEGDRIAVGELVFECKGYPASGWCGQSGYEPMNEENPMPDAWKDAWTLVGYCDGSMGPTASPSFDEDNIIGACPDEWVARTSPEKYEEGDMVAVTISTDPERQIAYRCKAFPYSGHCGKYSPVEFGGDQGWQLAGPCDGSMGPTASPNFDSLSEIVGGCPEEFSSSGDYGAGDLVSVTVGEEVTNVEGSLRQVVYECKDDVHTSKYCSDQSSNLNPGEMFGYLGWTLKGYCDGTMTPTQAPTAYGGVAWFVDCTNSERSCSPGERANPAEAPGSTNCSCGATTTSSSNCKRQVCRYSEALAYSGSTTYANGHRVRAGNDMYTCKVAGWCNVGDRYEPGVGDVWRDAWTLQTDATTPDPDPTPLASGNGYGNPLGAPCTGSGATFTCAASVAGPGATLSCASSKCACNLNGDCGNNAYFVCNTSNECVAIGDGTPGSICFDDDDCGSTCTIAGSSTPTGSTFFSAGACAITQAPTASPTKPPTP